MLLVLFVCIVAGAYVYATAVGCKSFLTGWAITVGWALFAAWLLGPTLGKYALGLFGGSLAFVFGSGLVVCFDDSRGNETRGRW